MGVNFPAELVPQGEEETVEELRKNLCCLNDRISSGTCSTAVRDYLRGQNWRTLVHPRDDWKHAPKTIEQLELDTQSLDNRILECEPLVIEHLLG